MFAEEESHASMVRFLHSSCSASQKRSFPIDLSHALISCLFIAELSVNDIFLQVLLLYYRNMLAVLSVSDILRGMSNHLFFTLQVAPVIFRQLEAEALKAGVSMNDYVRGVLTAAAEKVRSEKRVELEQEGGKGYGA